MLLWLTSGLLLVLTYLLTYFMIRNRRPRNFPPGPAPLFAIGNLNLLYKNRKLHLTFHELGQQYNGIVGKN